MGFNQSYSFIYIRGRSGPITSRFPSKYRGIYLQIPQKIRNSNWFCSRADHPCCHREPSGRLFWCSIGHMRYFGRKKKTKQLPFYAISSHIPLLYIIVVALCHNVHALNLFQFWVCLLLLPECANFWNHRKQQIKLNHLCTPRNPTKMTRIVSTTLLSMFKKQG